MRRCGIVGLVVAFLAVVGIWPSAARGETIGPRALVQDLKHWADDGEGVPIQILDMITGKIVGTISDAGPMKLALKALDDTRVLLLQPGQSEEALLSWNSRPKTKSRVAIIDTVNLRVLARHELGYGLGPLVPKVGPDERTVSIYCRGYLSNKPGEARPVEVFTVDLATGRLLSRTSLDRQLDNLTLVHESKTAVGFSKRFDAGKRTELPAQLRFIDTVTGEVRATLGLHGSAAAPVFSPDGRSAIVVSPPEKKPKAPARVQFVDVASGTLLGVSEIDGPAEAPTLSHDGRYLYVVDPGKPSRDPEKNINGKVTVFSVVSRKVEAVLDVGSDPRAPIADPKSNDIFLLSNGSSFNSGILQIVQGASVVATHGVGYAPSLLQFSRDRGQLFIAHSGGLSIVDRVAPAVVGKIAFAPGPADELVVSEDGKRGYLLHAHASQVAAVDLETMKAFGSVKVGPDQSKNEMYADVFHTRSSSARLATDFRGEVEFHVNSRTTGDPVPLPRSSLRARTKDTLLLSFASKTSLTVSPDGRIAYFATSRFLTTLSVLNERLVEVEVFRSDGTMTRLAGGATLLLWGGEHIWVVDTSNRSFPDPNRKKLVFETGRGEMMDVFPTPGGTHALVAGSEKIQSFNGSTRELVGEPLPTRFPLIVMVEAKGTTSP